MNHNKAALSEVREMSMIRRAQKDPLIKFILLMNEYHAIELAYFPSEERRIQYRKDIKDELYITVRKIPKQYGKRIKTWITSPSAWKEEIDSIHVKM